MMIEEDLVVFRVILMGGVFKKKNRNSSKNLGTEVGSVETSLIDCVNDIVL